MRFLQSWPQPEIAVIGAEEKDTMRTSAMHAWIAMDLGFVTIRENYANDLLASKPIFIEKLVNERNQVRFPSKYK
jgi:hypothetical protein